MQITYTKIFNCTAKKEKKRGTKIGLQYRAKKQGPNGDQPQGRSLGEHMDQISRNMEWSSLGLLQICEKTIDWYNENSNSKSQYCSLWRLTALPQISTDPTSGPPKMTGKRLLKTGHPPGAGNIVQQALWESRYITQQTAHPLHSRSATLPLNTARIHLSLPANHIPSISSWAQQHHNYRVTYNLITTTVIWPAHQDKMLLPSQLYINRRYNGTPLQQPRIIINASLTQITSSPHISNQCIVGLIEGNWEVTQTPGTQEHGWIHTFIWLGMNHKRMRIQASNALRIQMHPKSGTEVPEWPISNGQIQKSIYSAKAIQQ